MSLITTVKKKNENNHTMGQRLKFFRKKHLDISQEKLAELCGVDQSSISLIETGKTKTTYVETIAPIIKNTDINPHWFLLGEGPMLRERPIPAPEMKIEVIERYRRAFADRERVQSYVAIPLLSDPAAAGNARLINDDDIEGFAVIYGSWVRNPDDYRCVRIRGNSMSPLLESGSIVAINLSEKDPRELKDKIVAFRVNGGVTIKWLRMHREDFICAEPENRKEGEYYVFQGEEIDRAIIGKVEWWWGHQR